MHGYARRPHTDHYILLRGHEKSNVPINRSAFLQLRRRARTVVLFAPVTAFDYKTIQRLFGYRAIHLGCSEMYRFIEITALCLVTLVSPLVNAEDTRESALLPKTPIAPKGELSHTERCTVRKDANGWWLVSPDGEPFFSLGVCMFNQGAKKEEYDPAKPSYSALRHYDAPEAWADASLRRLKEWGFTTVGGWSDYEALGKSDEHDLWATPVLHLGSRSGVPWFDMWDEKQIRRIKELAEETIVPLRDDPRIIGYYSDNELGWWNAIHWKMTLEQPATSGQRQRLIRLVRDTYDDDWNSLEKDFVPAGAKNWDELERAGMLWLRPGSDGIRTMRRFLGMTAVRYYQLMRDTIRAYDPDAMYLGDRYQSFYYPQVPAAARKYVDVVSTNLNSSWNDGTFIRSYLDTLHSLTSKPILVSEFYMAAEENRSGNKNAVGGFPAVATQKARSEALANTLRDLGRLPYVVGADWFQYYDEPPHGRKLDGEDYNFGLVDIHDEPYGEVAETFAAFEPSELRSRAAEPRPDARGGVPPAPKKPLADFVFMNALKSWDRERGFVPPASKNPLGDLYICWSKDALYLGTFVLDIIEPDYYQDSKVPEIDRAKWTVQINGKKPVSARVGAGAKPVLTDPLVEIESVSGTYHDVRCISVIKIQPQYLGKSSFESGDRIKLDSSFDTHGRAERIEWKGNFVLSE
jgi:hypothetical protein